MRVWALVAAASAAVLLRPGTSDAVRVRYEDEETELDGEPDGNQAEGAESEVVAPVEGGEALEAAPEAGAGGEGEQISTPAEQINTQEGNTDSVACTLLPTWWKSRIANPNNIPDGVDQILNKQLAKEEYVNLMTAVLATPKALLGNWKLSEVYKVMWTQGWEAQFEAKNVSIFLQKVAKQVGGSEKSICFAAKSSNIQNIADQYHDNKDGLGTLLPPHVVAWVLQPARSAGGQEELSSESTEASIDLDKFVKSGGSESGSFDIVWEEFKVAVKQKRAPDKHPESHAKNLLTLTQNYKDKFRPFNVTPTACYSREYAFSWQQLFNGYHLRLWVELKDSNEAKDYHTNHAILPRRTCETLDDVGPVDQPLEMQALLQTHSIAQNYADLATAMRESKGNSPWDLAKVYQAMYDLEATLLDSRVAMSLTKVAGADNICFIDLDQTIVEVDAAEFHDGDEIRTSTSNMKTLDHSIFAETLSNTSGQLLLPEFTPVDVKRMLERRGAKQIHQEMKASLSELDPNPKGLPVQIRDVQQRVETFRQGFRQRGINIFTCFAIEDITRTISPTPLWPAHVIFTWLEFAEIGRLHREYRPAESMPDLQQSA